MTTSKKSLVHGSFSVPLDEQESFNENKDRLMAALENIGKKISFSHAVRLFVNGAQVEIRDDGCKYLVVKL